MNQLRKIACLLLATTVAAGAAAQVGLPGLPLPPLPQVTDPVTGTLRTAQSTALTQVRQLRIRELLRTERDTVETDPDGQPILRRQVGALSPTPEALAGAQALGFTVLRAESLAGLDLRLVILQAPEGMSTRRALKRLRELDPGGSYDFNHLYLDSGAQSEPAAVPAPVPASLPEVPAPHQPCASAWSTAAWTPRIRRWRALRSSVMAATACRCPPHTARPWLRC